MTTRKIGHDYEISDDFWKKIEPLLPLPKPKKKSERPRKDDRKIMSAIFYIPSYWLPMESIANL
jgi:transposase